MPRYRIDLAYDGTGFRGYARQEGLRTVQGELEGALATLLGGSVETAVAGRTDAGVHARGQVASFDAEPIDTGAITRSLNGILGPEIAVRAVTEADTDFHARFSAKSRRYRYTIDQRAAAEPLDRNRVWAVGRRLDVAAMAVVAGELAGEHDFSSFCRSVEDRSNVRLVTEARWEEEGSDLIHFWIQANAFCHQMVRSLVGFAYDVGRGFSDPAATGAVIAARDRAGVATVAPPHGLTLWEVDY
jgi:tRNA pseudouridine38-40 synthase